MEYGNGQTNQLVWRQTDNRYHHEETGLTLDNLNVNISILGKQIIENSMVLDVGCGEGKLFALIKEKHCNVYAIELDEEAIKYARDKKRYADIFNFNIENPETNIEEYERFCSLQIKFDYIVLADILEHTINPTKVLMEVSKFLKDDGKILISVPNVNNADIILNLLRGRFNYMQAGILDNTHTKYFTKLSFVEWINEINDYQDAFYYDCEYLGGIYGLTNYLEEIKKEMPQVYQYIQLNPEYNIIQNMYILHRKEKGSKLPYLDALLKEERIDLVKILSEYLKNGLTTDYAKAIGSIKMLSNERVIMEERAVSAEIGWEACDKKLAEAEKAIELLKKENAELAKVAEQNMQGWKESDKRLQEAEEGWKKSDKRLQEAEEGWRKTDKRLQEAIEGWKLCDRQLQGLKGGQV